MDIESKSGVPFPITRGWTNISIPSHKSFSRNDRQVPSPESTVIFLPGMFLSRAIACLKAALSLTRNSLRIFPDEFHLAVRQDEFMHIVNLFGKGAFGC